MRLKEGELTVDQSKLEKILSLKPPKTLRQLRGLLGMTSYYRKYIEGYSRIMAPLIKLLKKDSLIDWNENCDEAFKKIKSILTSAPILALPNSKNPFVLAIDFSYDGMGMVLSQIQEGKEKVIGYYSRSLSPGEKKYAATEGECAAIVWGVNKVRPFIMGNKFFIHTDHQALVWLLSMKSHNAKLCRWASILS